ncbi:hypothetical protein [Pseudonocardia lacus]|uniref:hypothetical protein n=1 Tax=Pseudonocardia lacus TaxID=2835865 RepID=UPI001BDD2430|nr:hypothetical protein [Pseudonocardia lacus]
MRRLLAVVFVVLLVPAVGVWAAFAAREPVRGDIAAVGCGGASSEHQEYGSRSIWSISVTSCVDASGRPLAAEEVVATVAQVTWRAPAATFDSVLITVFRRADGARGTRPVSREIPRHELEAMWGARPAELDRVSARDLANRLLGWLALPAMAVAVALPVALGVVAARRGVFFLVWRS